MRWTPGGRSSNLEDRRGQRAGFSVGRGGLGIGGFVVLLILSLVFKKDFFSLLGAGDPASQSQTSTSEPGTFESTPDEEKLVDFVSFVLDDTQAEWARILPTLGKPYQPAHLVLFRDAAESACGYASAASGPFYCPADEKLYIDLGFYGELQERFGAPGDFAQAYVIAHEMGHHVQNQLGIASQVREASAANPEAANQLSVLLELQADCFAGVWGHGAATRGVLEPGDLEEGLNAAAAIGDDRLQKMTTGRVVPDGFTHGTSAQRVEWLKRGLQSGNCEDCDTFARLHGGAGAN